MRFRGAICRAGGVVALCLSVSAPAAAIDGGRVNYAAAQYLARVEQPFILTDAEIYLAFHQAIAAVTICGGREFGREDHYAMGEVIDFEIRWALGAARRLEIVEEAKADMRRRAARGDCDAPEVGAAYRLFRERLWPALAARWHGRDDPTGLVGSLSGVGVGRPPQTSRLTRGEQASETRPR